MWSKNYAKDKAINSIESLIQELKAKDQYRELKELVHLAHSKVIWNKRSYLNLSSNDYMGLLSDRSAMQSFLLQSSKEFDFSLHALSSSSSRLLTGNSAAYSRLEKTLCQWYNQASALVFNSGYHANLGILSAFSQQDTQIFSDKLNHASLIDGMRLTAKKYYRYRHLDYEHLEKLLEQHRDPKKQSIIVSESLFSMDGDIADLKRLVSIKQKYDCLLYIDEAHAVGVRGNTGLGICEEQDCVEDIDLIVGTFGKAVASVGAYVICAEPLREFLINSARPFIFTTALPPLNLLWTIEVINKIRTMQKERENLIKLAKRLQNAILESGYESRGSSQIVPLILGENDKAVALAKLLQENAFLVFPIRPPTVPPGTARLRFSLNAGMDWSLLETIPQILKQ